MKNKNTRTGSNGMTRSRSSVKSDKSNLSVQSANGDRTACSNIIQFDLFRHSFDFQLPNGFDSVPSRTGLFATFLIILTVIAYGVIHAIELA